MIFWWSRAAVNAPPVAAFFRTLADPAVRTQIAALGMTPIEPRMPP